MSDGNRIKLLIGGAEYTFSSDESEGYTRTIAEELDLRLKDTAKKNPQASATATAVLTALSLCDEAYTATATADNLRLQVRDFLTDITESRKIMDELKRENSRLKREVQFLEAQLKQRETFSKRNES